MNELLHSDLPEVHGLNVTVLPLHKGRGAKLFPGVRQRTSLAVRGQVPGLFHFRLLQFLDKFLCGLPIVKRVSVGQRDALTVSGRAQTRKN